MKWWRRFHAHTKWQDGCLIWVGACKRKHTGQGGDNTGYGQFHYHGRTHQAHRFLAQRIRRKSLAGRVVHHTCGNRACVYVKHLQITSIRGNNLAAWDARRRAQNPS